MGHSGYGMHDRHLTGVTVLVAIVTVMVIVSPVMISLVIKVRKMILTMAAVVIVTVMIAKSNPTFWGLKCFQTLMKCQSIV